MMDSDGHTNPTVAISCTSAPKPSASPHPNLAPIAALSTPTESSSRASNGFGATAASPLHVPAVRSLSSPPPALSTLPAPSAAPSSALASAAVEHAGEFAGPYLARNADTASRLSATLFTSHTGSLRFTCSRCRMAFLVQPGERRSRALAHASNPRSAPTPLSFSQSSANKRVSAATSLSPASPEHTVRAAATVAAAAATANSASSSSVCSAVQASVEHSFNTCGTGRRYRPLQPPGVHTPPHDEHDENHTGGVFADAHAARQRAFLDALQLDFFSPSEAFTDDQLEDILAFAQQTVELNRSSHDEEVDVGVFASPWSRSTSSQAEISASPHLFMNAARASSTDLKEQRETFKDDDHHRRKNHHSDASESPHGQDAEQVRAIVDVSQLASLGVTVHAPPLSASPPTGVDVVAPLRRHQEKPPAQQQHEERGSDASRTGNNTSSSIDSDTRSPPALTLVDTQVMLPCEGDFDGINETATPPTTPRTRQQTSNRASAAEAQTTLSPVSFLSAAVSTAVDERTMKAATDQAPLLSTPPPPRDVVPLSVPKVTAQQANRADACCGAMPKSCPVLKQAAAQVVHEGTAESALPFDELYRRWMRLLVSSSLSATATDGKVSHAQPLCLDCWSTECILPLQRQVQRAWEEGEMLDALLHRHPAEEKQRLWTLVSEVASNDSSVPPTSHEKKRTMMQQRKTPSLLWGKSPSVCFLPASLDAVAANIFGPHESEWLEALSALSAPHQRRSYSDAFEKENCPADAAVTHRTSLRDLTTGEQERDGDEDDALLLDGTAELQELLAALKDVQAQQAALNAQKRELYDVLQALGSKARVPSSAHAPVCENETDGVGSARPSISSFHSSSTKEAGGGADWASLAVTHHIREVQAAFTTRDEAAERRRTTQDLMHRFAFVTATSVDALCFPIDVSGPMGMIAGLRLGFVLPYPGSVAPAAASSATTVDSRHHAEEQVGRAAQQRKRHLINSSSPMGAPESAVHSHRTHADGFDARETEEAMHLEGFVRRQVQYAQLFLSGNFTGPGVDAALSGYGGAAHSTAATAAATHNTRSSSAVDSLRVSVAEVNAACGYLSLLLNYLAHVNGFSFQTAILRPAGDRSTVAILKRTSSTATTSGRIGAATAAAAAPARSTASAFSLPFSLFGMFSSATEVKPPTTANTASTGAASWNASRAAYVVDHEVDFYLTDRLFAWRTFGPACVAVAACVRELSDALRESLRCWRVRENLVHRHPCTPEGEDGATPASMTIGTETAAEEGGWVVTSASQNNSFGGASTAPVSLPRLVELLERREDALPSSLPPRSPTESTTREAVPVTDPVLEKEEARAAPLTSSEFPVHPPYRIVNDTVDGFSVRHGSVSEAIWTLGMKKLLANVQWCMAATVELERLYAESGEGEDVDGDDA